MNKQYSDMLHNGLSVAFFGLFVFVLTSLFAGCRNFGEEEVSSARGGESVAVTVLDTWGVDYDGVSTRSSVADVSLVKSASVAAYRLPGGQFESSASAADVSGLAPGAMSLTLAKGYSYRIYTIANCGTSPVSWPARESELASVRVSFSDGEEYFPGGAPMAGTEDITFTDDVSLVLHPKRMVAEWTVKFRDADALGYQVTFVRMRQAAKDVSPWTESKANSVFDTGDRGVSADLSAVTGSGAQMYVLENARGVLSSLSPSHSARESDIIAADSEHYGLYTYLEIGLHFPDGAEYMRDPAKASAEEDVIYRVYLRGSAYNDFSVIRNKRMSLTLTGTRAGIDDPSIDWRIEDNTVPAGNVITGTVYPVDWEDGDDLLSDHFTPTIYNLIVKAAGVASWRDYSTMQSILDDSAVMTAVCGSDEAVYLIVSELEPTTDIKAFEAKVDELELGATIDGALSGSAYFDKLDYSSADVSSTPTAYNTRRNYPADAGHCWFEDEDRVIVIFKGAMWYNNYESVTFPPPSQTYGDSLWYLRRIIAHPVLNPDLVFVDQIGSNSSSLVSGTTVKTSPFRASFCGIYLSNDTNAVINRRDESNKKYPTYELLTSYLLKTGYKVPSGVIYAKADWTGRSNAGYNLVPNTADMTSSSFKKPKKTSGSFTGYDAMRTVVFGSLDGYSTDVPSPGHVGKPLEKSYVFHPSYSEWGDYVPQFVLAENITPHDKHLIVSCYIKSKTGTGYSAANVKLCLRDAENTLKGESLVEKVNGAAYFEAEHMISMNSTTEYYGNRLAFSSNGTWTRVTVAFTLTDEGAERPLQIGLYADRMQDTYTDGGVDYDYECDLYVAAFMVEPGTVDHGYVPFWNEGRGFSVDASDVYSDRAEAGRARCTWYAKTWDSPADLDGDPNVLPYRHNWQWEEWKPLGRSLAE